MPEPLLPRRPLGKTGLQVAPIGLAALAVRGTRRRGGPGLTADEVERAFHEHGINTFLVHHLMRRQGEGVRRLIKAGHRDQLVLVSEVAIPLAGAVRRGLDRQLRALGTDHLDVWLIGWLRSRFYARPSVWSTMERLRQAGLTRAIGFSSHDRPLATALAQELPVDVLMIRYNAAHRGAEREIFAPLAELGDRRPGIIAYTATRWGMLLDPLPSRGFPTALSAPECYRFVLGPPEVDLVWCAATSMDELREDVAAVAAGPLSAARRAEACRFGDAVHDAARGGFRWMFGRGAG